MVLGPGPGQPPAGQDAPEAPHGQGGAGAHAGGLLITILMAIPTKEKSIPRARVKNVKEAPVDFVQHSEDMKKIAMERERDT